MTEPRHESMFAVEGAAYDRGYVDGQAFERRHAEAEIARYRRDEAEARTAVLRELRGVVAGIVAECGYDESHDAHEYVVADEDGNPADRRCPGLRFPAAVLAAIDRRLG